VIFSGVMMTTIMTLFVVPVVYDLMARHTGSPEAVSRKLNTMQNLRDDQGGETPSAPMSGSQGSV